MEIEIVCENGLYMPTYANETDACMDLRVKISSPHKDTIGIGETKIFGTGIKVKIPKGYVMLIFPRSSTGMKLHCAMANGTGVIDSGYRDEVKLALYNFGDKHIELTDGQRIAQFLIIPRPKLSLVWVDDDEKFRDGDRGGGVGSTGQF